METVVIEDFVPEDSDFQVSVLVDGSHEGEMTKVIHN